MVADDDSRSQSPWRRGPALVIAALVLAVVGWLIANATGLFEVTEAPPSATRQTTEVGTADLTHSFEADGTLLFADIQTIVHPSAGTITALISPATIIANGDVLFAVDNVPTVALHGETPAWRTMTIDSEGHDVTQLETALRDLGYDTAGTLTVDGVYTDYTAELVTQWQADLGVEETGTLEYGSIVFVGPDTQVGTVTAVLGEPVPAAGVLQVHGANRITRLEIDVRDVSSMAVGDTLQAQLPYGAMLDIVVTDLTPFETGVWLASGDPLELPAGAILADEVPVEVSWTVSSGEQVVVVPAAAIKRLDSGQYVVEVQNGSPSETAFVPIEIGQQSGSQVEVVSPLEVGTVIVSP